MDLGAANARRSAVRGHRERGVCGSEGWGGGGRGVGEARVGGREEEGLGGRGGGEGGWLRGF